MYILTANCLFVVSAFLVVPTDACLACGGSTEFNCSTTYTVNRGRQSGNFTEGAGGQMWIIQIPNGTTVTLSSHTPSVVPSDLEFISPHTHEYTGLRVMNTNSNWNGTTLQCIAFSPTNLGQINKSNPVTLEVGGECNFT